MVVGAITVLTFIRRLRRSITEAAPITRHAITLHHLVTTPRHVTTDRRREPIIGFIQIGVGGEMTGTVTMVPGGIIMAREDVGTAEVEGIDSCPRYAHRVVRIRTLWRVTLFSSACLRTLAIPLSA